MEGVAVGPLSIEEAASYFALQALQDGLFVGGAYFVGRLLRETYHTRQARK